MRILQISGLFISLLSCFSCAHQSPGGLDFFDGDGAPIRWKQSTGRSFGSVTVNTVLATNKVEANGKLSSTFRNGTKILLDGIQKGQSPVSGRLRVDRGFYTNVHSKTENHERHIELFRGSPIISVFDRSTKKGPFYEFSLNSIFSHITYFEKYKRVTSRMRSITLSRDKTFLPFVVLHNEAESQGVVLHFPHPAEERKWFTEDYLVNKDAGFQINVRLDGRGTHVEISGLLGELSSSSLRTTQEGPLMMMPFDEGINHALENFQLGRTSFAETEAKQKKTQLDYWSLDTNHGAVADHDIDLVYMRRYFPAEFASWIDSTPLAQGHDGGFAWGMTTKSMKAIRVNPKSKRFLFRDHAFRMLAFFVEAGKQKGAPPLLVDVPSWSKRFSPPELIYSVVFCQFWEFRLPEFISLLQSPYLLSEEKEKLYRDLQRARLVYDPESEYSWSLPAGPEGLWFDYFDVRLSPVNTWIINTHATAINNVGLLAEISETMKKHEDHAYWTRLFIQGVNGLLYATNNRWMWTKDDANELAYGRYWAGPALYHELMATVWLPEMIEHAAKLAPKYRKSLIDLLIRCTKARMLTEDANKAETVKKILTKYAHENSNSLENK